MRRLEATRAYQAAKGQRGLREQEAEVFHRVNARLRAAQRSEGGELPQALADNDRLWITVIDQLRDPRNGLPPPLRASIISVGLAVQREAGREAPDINFLVGINEQLAAGLMGR